MIFSLKASRKIHSVLFLVTLMVSISGLYKKVIASHVSQASEISQSAPVFIGSHDVPLATGLLIDEDQLVELDKPEGQISEYTAYGMIDTDVVISFYKAAMQPLGWSLKKATQNSLDFQRNHESVTIRIEDHLEKMSGQDNEVFNKNEGDIPDENSIVVRFRIVSQNQ